VNVLPRLCKDPAAPTAEYVATLFEEPTPTLQGFTDAEMRVSIARHMP
jgi:hypothetical protein